MSRSRTYDPQGGATVSCWNIIFLSLVTPISIQDNEGKTNLLAKKSSLIKFGLIVYISAARIVIDRMDSF